MDKLQGSFFARRADEVAQDLLGRYLVCRRINDEITSLMLTQIGAYEGIAKTSPEGMYASPGFIFTSTKYGKPMIHIATRKRLEPSCLTLVGGLLRLEDKSEKILGSASLAKRLGITNNNRRVYEGLISENEWLWIKNEQAPIGEIVKVKGNAPNCVGVYRLK